MDKIGKRVKYLFVMGTNYSGSTITALLLNTLSESFFVGEPALIYRKVNGKYHHSVFCTNCRGESRSCPIWDSNIEFLREKKSNYFNVLNNAIGDNSVIIDSSKSLDWINYHMQHNKDVTIIHIIRPVHEFIASLIKKKELDRNSVMLSSINWVRSNDKIKQFAVKSNIRYMFIKYPDLIFATEETLKKIWRLLEINIPLKRKEQPLDLHYVKGNPNVAKHLEEYLNEGIKLQYDESWKNTLNNKQLSMIFASPKVRNKMKEMQFSLPQHRLNPGHVATSQVMEKIISIKQKFNRQ